jgi:hypothetical protein
VQRDTGPDEGSGSDPTALLHDYGLGHKIEGFRFKFVRARAQEGPLGDAYMGFDSHSVEAENHHFFANPHMVADFQPPRKIDVHLRADHHTAPDLGSEGSKHRATQA